MTDVIKENQTKFWVDEYVCMDTALLEDGQSVQIGHLMFSRPTSELEAVKLTLVHANMFNLTLTDKVLDILTEELGEDKVASATPKQLFMALSHVEIHSRNVVTQEERDMFDKDGELSEILDKAINKVGEFNHDPKYFDNLIRLMKKPKKMERRLRRQARNKHRRNKKKK